MTQSIYNKTVRFLESEEGPTAVEYAVMLALLIGAMIAAIGVFGTEVDALSVRNRDAIQGALNP